MPELLHVKLLPALRQRYVDSRGFARWGWSGWGAPASPAAKRAVLARANIAGATWVETGTYRDDTTAFLARMSPRVVSIEPDESLSVQAVARFRDLPHVTVIRGTSEQVFEGVVRECDGPVCFWLDGHYSGPGTHQAATDTPVQLELEVIARNIDRLGQVSVCIDDFREFPSGHTSLGNSPYPSRDFLVQWASGLGMKWTVEHDIFIASTDASN